jgi:hypothetical protein
LWTSTGLLFLIAATPLSRLWFDRIMGISPELSAMARQALWIFLPLPALTVLQSWYQGAILHGRRTRGVSEAVIIYLVINGAILGAGVAMGRFTGLYVGAVAMTLSLTTQTVWLYLRARPVLTSAATRSLIPQTAPSQD